MKYLPKDSGTWVRLIALIVTVANEALLQANMNPIPLDETSIGHWVSFFAMLIAVGAGYYKNNSHTDGGKIGTNITRNIKNGVTDIAHERKDPSEPRG